MTTSVAPHLVLASSSPARQKILTDAGIKYSVMVSDVDEDAVLRQAQETAYSHGLGEITPAQTAQLLAQAKAQDVAQQLVATPDAGALVLGCDSVFEFEGRPYGKPHTAEVATQRITAMQGKTGILHTGHWLVDTRTGQHTAELRSATVHFASMSEEEITAYVTTGEPLWVAGSFTIDGFGAGFITGIEGEFHTVVGLSVNALRSLLAKNSVSLPEIWKKS
ncbi:nucleoside triphosphate pyrophosphatase [Rothia sp. ZJ1223]|uniref:Maf family protein n=1 Tax=Rothia sp. ZJ1223 TaxID=2811098 RepID=UPI00195A2E89|nr:nucleoside triphosphate pyrophosphatase [Rothia sp. ZJ1223]MBM7051371.1 septum formation inhibitor Maf [Rothia sp. ZJ1223]